MDDIDQQGIPWRFHRGLNIKAERNDAAFTCAICGKFKAADPTYISFRDRNVAPICNWCEHIWGSKNPLLDGAGAYADRRVVIQIKALGMVIDCSAYCQQGGHAQPYSEKENSK